MVTIVDNIDMPEPDCRKVWERFLTEYQRSPLARSHIKLPTYGTCRAYQLIALFMNMGEPVHKDAISGFVIEHMRMNGHTASGDQQVRHLQASGYNVLTRGCVMPNGEPIPNGCYMLADLNVSRKYNSSKRATRLNDADWLRLKSNYDNTCATCGRCEGTIDDRTGRIVSLQQGHMDPGKPLVMSNTVPQCSYCNQSARDRFVFNKNGSPEMVNDAYWLANHMTKDCRGTIIRMVKTGKLTM